MVLIFLVFEYTATGKGESTDFFSFVIRKCSKKKTAKKVLQGA